MAEVSGDPRAVENLKSYLDVIKESYAANPWKARLLLVLTADDSDPQFSALEEGLRARAAENSAKAISGIGLYMANFAILLLEGLTSGVMGCMRWLDTLCQSQKVKQGLVLYFSDCLEPAGLLAKEFARFAPDPRALQNLLSSSKTFSLLFSVPEFCENLLGDFYATLPRDRTF
ncbi:hypothetical protein, conserved [Eimeria necatrix]|uniref:Uncharacterized protein n=1 Tax=Eimeria necatrix TaxID=51315 RepID=U6N4A3_9EIME|nr:hypothetical protein, conserved [Eimeria necatrix]CDJ69535.1 hypothetical protein, conserved [Eimeria necatrix]